MYILLQNYLFKSLNDLINAKREAIHMILEQNISKVWKVN